MIRFCREAHDGSNLGLQLSPCSWRPRISERLRYHFNLTLRMKLLHCALHLSTFTQLSTGWPA